MAKEALIRQKAIKELTDKGWVVSVPIRSRFGSVRLYWGENSKGCDDIFSIADLIAWRGDDLLLLQYTSTSNVSARRMKIKKFMTQHGVAPACRIEVWGYKDRVGFQRKEHVN